MKACKTDLRRNALGSFAGNSRLCRFRDTLRAGQDAAGGG